MTIRYFDHAGSNAILRMEMDIIEREGPRFAHLWEQERQRKAAFLADLDARKPKAAPSPVPKAKASSPKPIPSPLSAAERAAAERHRAHLATLAAEERRKALAIEEKRRKVAVTSSWRKAVAKAADPIGETERATKAANVGNGWSRAHASAAKSVAAPLRQSTAKPSVKNPALAAALRIAMKG